MQTVESLIAALRAYPPDARCYAYEGEPLKLTDGTHVYSYIVVTAAEKTEHANGARYRDQLGCIPCSDTDTIDAPPESGT